MTRNSKLWSQRDNICNQVTKNKYSGGHPLDPVDKYMERDVHCAVRIVIRSIALEELYFSLYGIIREPIKDSL